jgi:quinol monooxygenase YgiN
MLKHIVLFKFKPEATAAQRKEMEDRLNALPGLISEIKSWKIVHTVPGRPARFSHLALFSEFEDMAALDRYIANPDHQAVLPLIEAACEQRSNFDYE